MFDTKKCVAVTLVVLFVSFLLMANVSFPRAIFKAVSISENVEKTVSISPNGKRVATSRNLTKVALSAIQKKVAIFSKEKKVENLMLGQNSRQNGRKKSMNDTRQQGANVSCLLRRFSPVPLPVTALTSVPGSGNTWSRHIIELITGIYTGSVYNDGSLKKIFKGEGKRDWSVVAVKIHEAHARFSGKNCKPFLNRTDCDIKRVIIVIRHPADAAMAEFKRRRTGSHTRDAHVSSNALKSFYAKRPGHWERFHTRWLNISQELSLPVFLLYYADLLDNFTTAATNLASFLGFEMDASRVQCLLKNQQGEFKRKSKEPTHDMLKESNSTLSAIKAVREMMASCVKEGRCVTSGSMWRL